MFINIFNNRELAIFSWMIIFIIWCVYKLSVRESLTQLIAAFFQRQIISSVTLMYLYIAIIVLIFHKSGFWDLINLKGTIYWSFGVAFIMLVNINNSSDDEDYFKKTFVNAFKMTVVIEYIINLYVFDFVIEIALFPVLLFLVMLQTIAELKVENKKVNEILLWILGLYVIGMFIFSIYNIYDNFSSFVTSNNLREFLLPLLFTVMFLPFIYFIALYSKYEVLFVRLGFFINDQELLKYAKWKTALTFHVNLKRLRKWAGEVGKLNFNSKEEIDDSLLKAGDI